MEGRPLVTAIICAAGLSLRMREKEKEKKAPHESSDSLKKEYLCLNDSPQSLTVLGSVVRSFAAVSSVSEIIIAIPENDEEKARRAIGQEYLESLELKLNFVNGGQTRQASVYNSLSAIRNNPNYVLIHDGARPWVSRYLIQNIIDAVQKYDAVVPLLYLTETPKEINNGFVIRHLKRANTGAAQTPQAFKYPEIFHAHKKAALEQEEFTDDAEIWGKFCSPVAFIPGESKNIKITFPEDVSV